MHGNTSSMTIGIVNGPLPVLAGNSCINAVLVLAYPLDIVCLRRSSGYCPGTGVLYNLSLRKLVLTGCSNVP